MVLSKGKLLFGAALLAVVQQQNFVAAQGLNRLTNGFIVEFVNAPDDSNRVRAEILCFFTLPCHEKDGSEQ